MSVFEVRSTEHDRAALVGLKPAVVTDAEVGYAPVVKPWGSEQCVAKRDNEEVWKLDLRAGAETSMHCHPNKETVLIVVAGLVEFETLADWKLLGPGSIVRIERGAFHRTRADVTGAQLLEIESPPNKRDLVRLSDKYGR